MISPMPLLSVVIPCFNEEGNVSVLVEKLSRLVEKDHRVEFILVDNGSTDGTGLILEKSLEGRLNLQLVQVKKNTGYGHGIKSGLNRARGEFLGWTHADLQTNPEDALLAMKFMRNASDQILIKGMRSGRPLSDRFFSAAMSIFETILFGLSLREINAQPTVFSASLLPIILEGPDDFSLDLYTLVEAKKRGYREYRFPVEFGPRLSGTSKWNFSIKSRIRFIARTIRFSLKLAKTQGTK